MEFFFFNKNPKFARFYLLPKIDKRLHNVSGRPVISNCGYYKKMISSFLDYRLQPLAKMLNRTFKIQTFFQKA